MQKTKLSLFADDVILHIENPTDATTKPLKFINKFGNVAEYKINTQKYLAFLYTNNKTSERKIKEIILFIIKLRRIKYPGINPPEEGKDLYSEN